jgi:hypothetical protein
MSQICPLFTAPSRALGASVALVNPEANIPRMLHRVLPLHQLVPGDLSLWMPELLAQSRTYDLGGVALDSAVVARDLSHQ